MADGESKVKGEEPAARPGIFLPPDLLGAYEDVIPGAAERMLKEWEEEAAHRRTMERRSQGYAFALAILFFAGSMTLILTDHSLEGVSVVIGEIAGLVSIFIFSQRRRQARQRRPPTDA